MAGVGNGSGGGSGGNIRAGRAFVELYAEDNKVFRALDRLKARFQSFAGLTIKAGVALGAGGAAALAPLTAVLGTLDEQGRTLGAANALGIDPRKASELFGIMKAGGSDLRDAVEGLATFGQRIDEGLSGKGDVAKELFDTLGTSAADFAALKPEERFYKLLDAVKGLNDPTKQLNALMKAVGEDTGKNLMQVLSLSAGEMRELAAASSMSAEELKAAQTASVRWKIATATLGNVWGQVAQALAPVLTSFAKWLKDVVTPFAAFVKENRAAVVVAVQVAARVAGVGAALVGLGLAAKVGAIALGGVTLVLKGIGLALAALLSPVGLVVAAIGGLGALILTQTDSGRAALGTLRDTFATIGETFTEAWGGIKAAVASGDLELAFQIAGKGIEATWRQMLAGMARAFKEFVEKNRDTLVALAAVTGALKGARVGRMAGPWGALVGAGVGAGAAGFGADAALDAIEKALDTKALDDSAARARRELEELVRKARAAPAPPGAAPILKGDAAARSSTAVGSQGSFTAAQAAQRFSLFDDVPLRQLKEQVKANKNLAAINANVGGLVRALAFK